MLGNTIIRQIITQFFGLISALLISIFTSRILGPERRGDFALLTNTCSFLTFFFGFNFGASVIHVIATKKFPERETINSTLFIIMILSAVCFATVILYPTTKLSLFIPSNGNPLFYKITLSCLFVVFMLLTLYNSILSGKGLFKEQQFLSISVSFLSILFYFILFLYKKVIDSDFNIFVFFYVALAFIPLLGSYFLYRVNIRPKFTFTFLNITQLKYILHFSLLSYLCGIFHFLCCKMDFWVIEYYNGSLDLGYYSLASNLAQMIWILPQAISIILITYSGQTDKTKVINNTNKLIRISLLFIFLIAFFLFLTIDFIVPTFFGEPFRQSSHLFKILLIGTVPFCVTTILSSYFAGLGKMQVNLFCSVSGFLTSLIFDLLLIPTFGNKGACYAAVLSYSITTFLIIYFYIQDSKTKFADLIFTSKKDFYFLTEKLKALKIK